MATSTGPKSPSRSVASASRVVTTPTIVAVNPAPAPRQASPCARWPTRSRRIRRVRGRGDRREERLMQPPQGAGQVGFTNDAMSRCCATTPDTSRTAPARRAPAAPGRSVGGSGLQPFDDLTVHRSPCRARSRPAANRDSASIIDGSRRRLSHCHGHSDLMLSRCRRACSTLRTLRAGASKSRRHQHAASTRRRTTVTSFFDAIAVSGRSDVGARP